MTKVDDGHRGVDRTAVTATALPDGEVVQVVRGREVRIRAARRYVGANGVPWIDVLVDGETDSGETHFRVFNPPTLARDPAGDVEICGIRYRHDPVAALAEVIAHNGGARKTRRGAL